MSDEHELIKIFDIFIGENFEEHQPTYCDEVFCPSRDECYDYGKFSLCPAMEMVKYRLRERHA